MPPFMLSAPSSVDTASLFGNLVAVELKDVDPQLVDNIMLQVMQIINVAKH